MCVGGVIAPECWITLSQPPRPSILPDLYLIHQKVTKSIHESTDFTQGMDNPRISKHTQWWLRKGERYSRSDNIVRGSYQMRLLSPRL